MEQEYDIQEELKKLQSENGVTILSAVSSSGASQSTKINAIEATKNLLKNIDIKEIAAKFDKAGQPLV